MSISDLILQAKGRRAQSILFSVGSAPQVRVEDQWNLLRDTPVLPSEWNILQQSVLNGQQRAHLETQGSVAGEGLFGGSRLGFAFFQNENTMKAWLNLELEAEAGNEGAAPAVLGETLRDKKGLVLLSGQRESGLAAAISAGLTRLNSEKVFSAVVFSAVPFPRLREEKALFLYNHAPLIDPATEYGLTAGVDLVVFHAYSDESSFRLALELAEKNLTVIYSMLAPSPFNALRRVYGFLERAVGAHGPARFAEVLELILGQISLRGISRELIQAYEVILLKPQVRQMIAHGHLLELEQLLQHAAENSGLVNANQALLQNLIRRRIDIKTAFAASRDPDGLDLLLKKVGI